MNLELAKILAPLEQLVCKKRDLYYKEGGYEYQKKLEELNEKRPAFSDSVSEYASRSVKIHLFSFNPFNRVEKISVPCNLPEFHLATYDKIHFKKFLRFPKFIKFLGIILLIMGIFLFGFPLTGDEMAIPKPEILQNDDPSTLTGPIVACMILGALVATVGIVLLVKLKNFKGNQEARYCSAHYDGRQEAYQKDFEKYKEKEDALKNEYGVLLKNTETNERKIQEILKYYPIPKSLLYPAAISDIIEGLREEYRNCNTLQDAINYAKECEDIREYETKKMVQEIFDAVKRDKEKRKKEFERQDQINQLDRAIDELKDLNKKLDELDRR